MATTTTAPTSGGSLFSGISDFFGSLLDRAPSVADSAAKVIAANAQAKAAAAQASALSQRDEQGRYPGQPGYGTGVTPAGVVVGSGGMFSGAPVWLWPVVAVVGVVALGVLVWKLVKS